MPGIPQKQYAAHLRLRSAAYCRIGTFAAACLLRYGGWQSLPTGCINT